MAAPRGFALLETLIALLVVSFGLLVLGRSQTRLWGAVDLARDQTDALGLIASDIDTQHHTGATALAALDALADQADTETTIGPTTYQYGRSVRTDPFLLTRAVESHVRWQDREGRWHRLSLPTLLPRSDRRAAGWLALAPDGATAAAPQGRATDIPPEARTLADGRIALKPRADRADTWLFDPATARIVATCTAPVGLRNDRLQATDVSACSTVDARLLSGWIASTGLATPLAASDAERPAGPVLAADLRLTLTSTGHPTPAWRCLVGSSDEPHPDAALPYWCMVQPAGTPAGWSGRLDLVPEGWTLADAADADAQARRICRYSADRDGNGLIDNPEHPAAYASVQGALAQQNFLVIAAAASCPVDAPVHLDLDDRFNATDDSTVAHQP